MDFTKPTISPTIVVIESTKLVLEALHTNNENRSQTWVFSLRDHLAHVTKDLLH